MRKWAHGYLVAALPLAVASFALPRYHLVVWGLLGWSASAAVLLGVHRNRPARRLPWVLVAVALAAFVAGDMAYDVLTQVLHRHNPFPSVADAFYVTMYPIFAWGLLGLVQSRNRERNLGPLLDTLIITASCGLFLIEPYVRAADITLLDKVVSISYPLGDIAILCVLAQLVVSVGLRNWSIRLLTVGSLGLLVADVLYGGFQLTGNWRAGGLTDVGWVLFYLCWGAAALHPSMRNLTETQPRREGQLSLTAFFGLGAATLLAPGLLVWRAATDSVSGDLGVIGLGSGVVFLLVLARLTDLARGQAAQAARERALRATSERLVAASQIQAIDAVAITAVTELLGPRVVVCVVTVAEGGLDRVVAAHPEALMGVRFDPSVPGSDYSCSIVTVDGRSVPGTTRSTQWRSFGFGASDGVERRVVIGHRGPMRAGSAAVVDGLAAQLTVAADRVELAEHLNQRKSEARFRSLIRNVSDVIMVVRPDGDVRSETPATEVVLGYADDVASTLRLADLLHPGDASTATASIAAMLAGTHSAPIRGEWKVRHADGRWLDMEVVGNDLSRDADVAGVVLTLRDVSDRKVLEQQLRHRAFHDSLTNLANRVLFSERVDQALKRRSRLGLDVSILLVDIDDFKMVNDTHGHAAGDAVLVQFADRLVNCLRGEDTAARFGGDEFAVCIETQAGQPEVVAAAQRVLTAMERPFHVADTCMYARVSIGIALASDATRGSTDLLREADLGLYAAKDAGKGSFQFFEHHLDPLEQRFALLTPQIPHL